MKKFIAVLAAIACLAALCACDEGGAATAGTEQAAEAFSIPEASSIPTPESAAETSATEETGSEADDAYPVGEAMQRARWPMAAGGYTITAEGLTLVIEREESSHNLVLDLILFPDLTETQRGLLGGAEWQALSACQQNGTLYLLARVLVPLDDAAVPSNQWNVFLLSVNLADASLGVVLPLDSYSLHSYVQREANTPLYIVHYGNQGVWQYGAAYTDRRMDLYITAVDLDGVRVRGEYTVNLADMGLDTSTLSTVRLGDDEGLSFTANDLYTGEQASLSLWADGLFTREPAFAVEAGASYLPHYLVGYWYEQVDGWPMADGRQWLFRADGTFHYAAGKGSPARERVQGFGGTWYVQDDILYMTMRYRLVLEGGEIIAHPEDFGFSTEFSTVEIKGGEIQLEVGLPAEYQNLYTPVAPLGFSTLNIYIYNDTWYYPAGEDDWDGEGTLEEYLAAWVAEADGWLAAESEEGEENGESGEGVSWLIP